MKTLQGSNVNKNMLPKSLYKGRALRTVLKSCLKLAGRKFYLMSVETIEYNGKASAMFGRRGSLFRWFNVHKTEKFMVNGMLTLL